MSVANTLNTLLKLKCFGCWKNSCQSLATHSLTSPGHLSASPSSSLAAPAAGGLSDEVGVQAGFQESG